MECCGVKCDAKECFCPTSAKAHTHIGNHTRYTLRYTVNYTYDVDSITPVTVGTITAPDCAVSYNVYENNERPERLESHEMVAPTDMEVVRALGHQHVGAINISMFVDDEFVCAAYPRYGSQLRDVEGEEEDAGYIVEISPCLDKDTTGSSILIKKGSRIRADSWYWVGSKDPRIFPFPGGTHLNVMGYLHLVYVET